MDPSDDILREVGRVAIFGAKLEDAHAWMLAALTDRPVQESLKMSTSALGKQIGRAADEHLLDKGLRAAVRGWLAEAKSILNERHAVVHSYTRGHFVGGELVLSGSGCRGLASTGSSMWSTCTTSL